MILSALGFLHMGFVDILDIVVVGLIIFMVFRWIRGSSAMNIFLAIISLFLCITSQSFRKSEHIVKDSLYGAFIGIVNVVNTSAVISSLGRIPASYFYPVYNIAIVLLCTIIGVIFLKERLSGIQIIGTILAVLSIILFYSILS